MSADTLLARLDRVRRLPPGDRWLACCPSHQDKRPSLSVRELDDGRVLVKCWAGCSFEEIIAAAGIDVSELFPRKPIEHGKRERRPFNAHDVLQCVAFEATIVAIAAGDLAQGKPISDTDRERLLVAAERLQSAATLANGSRR